MEASIEALQYEYTRGQRNPCYNRYYDAEAEIDLGTKISATRKKINDLYASVDGDINIQMNNIEQAIQQSFDKKRISPLSFYQKEKGFFREKNTKVNDYEEEIARLYRERNQLQSAIYDKYDREKATSTTET